MSKLVKGKGKGNGSVKVGVPFGSMKPSSGLQGAITKVAGAFNPFDRKETRKDLAAFYARFMKKYKNGTLSDFARQFDKTVPFHKDVVKGAEGYKKHRIYRACENVLRYAEVTLKSGKRKGSVNKKKTRKVSPTRERLKTLQGNVNRAERVLMATVFQLGLPRELFSVAAAKVGYQPTDVERLWSLKGALKDMGLGQFVVAMRSGPMAGQPAMKAIARSKHVTVPTTASIAAGSPVTSPASPKPATAGKVPSIAPSASTSKRVRRNPAAHTTSV